jgi:type II secretory pathway pseudopilin PulG
MKKLIGVIVAVAIVGAAAVAVSQSTAPLSRFTAMVEMQKVAKNTFEDFKDRFRAIDLKELFIPTPNVYAGIVRLQQDGPYVEILAEAVAADNTVYVTPLMVKANLYGHLIELAARQPDGVWLKYVDKTDAVVVSRIETPRIMYPTAVFKPEIVTSQQIDAIVSR